MSGTFDAGKTALRIGVPLFVVDPATFENQPPGNAKLIEMGGVAIRPTGGIDIVLDRIEGARAPVAKQDVTAEQLPLF